MKKKQEKAKVGRPKLADSDLKIDSTIMSMMGIVLILCLLIGSLFAIFS